MENLGMEEGEAIEHSWVTRAIENSQKKVEGRNLIFVNSYLSTTTLQTNNEK